ncbi:unnamed protein product [Timema podura]|uniref:Uncharacterized protein n=1 Tax=Timema podura TaxID=61482 RepID=A0ABN7NRL5_TIMPD|nr:unnamed protein product [Timema podura]
MNGLRVLSLIGQNVCDLAKSAIQNNTSSVIPALLHVIALINEYKQYIDLYELSCFCGQDEVDMVRKKKTTDAATSRMITSRKLGYDDKRCGLPVGSNRHTTLYNVEDKLSLANKVMEMGIYGHLVITPEIHRLAIERNGTSNSLDQIKIMFKMFKWLINSEKSMKDAQRLTKKLELDPSTFTTATSLYEKISLQLETIKRVSDLHCKVSAANVAMELIILCILLEGSQDKSVSFGIQDARSGFFSHLPPLTIYCRGLKNLVDMVVLRKV